MPKIVQAFYKEQQLFEEAWVIKEKGLSDVAVKQIILSLKDKRSFLIADLDDQHVFVEASNVEWLREQLNQILEENAYQFVTKS